jgi:glycyl-tRNA synthetase
MSVLRQDGSRFIAHVVEPSFGLDRLFYVTMETAYERREKRNVFRFPRRLAPYSVGVFSLVTKDGLPEKAAEIGKMLVNEGFMVASDDSGSIGRRYARQDEIGTPLNVTVDYDTIEKGLVTIRDRDSWRQVSVYVNDLREKLRAYFDGAEFTSLGPLVQKPEV